MSENTKEHQQAESESRTGAKSAAKSEKDKDDLVGYLARNTTLDSGGADRWESITCGTSPKTMTRQNQVSTTLNLGEGGGSAETADGIVGANAEEAYPSRSSRCVNTGNVELRSYYKVNASALAFGSKAAAAPLQSNTKRDLKSSDCRNQEL